MTFLPISINITNKRILLIGGGRIASHKIQFLTRFTDNIQVIALEVCRHIKAQGISYIEKPYETSDLSGAFLVYACTNIGELNKRIKADAESLGILTNVVDSPLLCDFISPAIYKHHNYTIAVSSNAQNVHRAVAIRDKIGEFLSHDTSIFHQST